MIFVTVGTHEQPFNRLIKEMDDLVANGKINEKVVIQYGFSSYKAKNCEMHKMMSYSDMQNYFKNARIVVTHGGPSSFIEVLQYDKIPIVVPRQSEFNEHVNNHQVDFIKLIEKKMGNIIPIYDINNLGDAIIKYDSIIRNKKIRKISNNKKFNNNLEKIVNELVL